jgi:hypothetical protein
MHPSKSLTSRKESESGNLCSKKRKMDFKIQINYNLDNLSFLFLTFMPKPQSGCEKQFRA